MGSSLGKTAIFAVAGLAVLAGGLVLTAAGLLVSGSDDNSPIEIKIPTPPPDPEPAASVEQLSAGPVSTGGPIKVYVSGAVRRPGVYELNKGDRLEDALSAAGGVVEGADLETINLANKVRDEGYYHVSRLGETPRPEVVEAAVPLNPSLPGESESSSESPLIDLNTATLDSLDSLPGIGPVRAQAIVDFRQRNGPFASVEDILDVQGIADGIYEQLRGLVTVGPPR